MKVLCVLLLAPMLSSAATVYTDYSTWSSAAGHSILTETFAGNQINTPGFSVFSTISFHNFTEPGPGAIVGNAWVDEALKYETTVWTFDHPMYAFGAYFDMPEVDSGLMVGYHWMPYPPVAQWPLTNPYPPFHSFWGFVSSTPFTTVDIWFGNDHPDCACYGQGYSMKDVSFASDLAASAPEPGTAVLAMLGLGTLLVSSLLFVTLRPRR